MLLFSMLHPYFFRLAALLSLLALAATVRAQSVGIGTTSPAPSALLELSSTRQGLLPPRLTQAQRDAIASPAVGLTIFNTDTNALNVWNGVSWTAVISAATGPLTGSVTSAVAFTYTNGPQTYTVPAGITSLQVVATGASGGGVDGASGGLGAQVRATLTVVPGEVLTVLVGGAGSVFGSTNPATGGYNGGGDSFAFGSATAGGGGGATALLRATTLGKTGDYLSSRNALLVAAGGGGGAREAAAGGFSASGGAGGLPSPGGSAGGNSGGGATQTGPGSGGGIYLPGQDDTGGNGFGGGGGGYYGGGGGAAGGGGSSWVQPTSSAVSYAAAGSAGNGSLTITPSLPALALDGTNITGVIKSQTTPQVGASFNVAGSGTVGGQLVASSLRVAGTSTLGGSLRLGVRVCPVDQTTGYTLTTADLAYSIFKVQNFAFAPSLTLPGAGAGQAEGQELTILTTVSTGTLVSGTNTDNPAAAVALASISSSGQHAVKYVWALAQNGASYWVRVQ
jgi:hypothetical protein